MKELKIVVDANDTSRVKLPGVRVTVTYLKRLLDDLFVDEIDEAEEELNRLGKMKLRDIFNKLNNDRDNCLARYQELQAEAITARNLGVITTVGHSRESTLAVMGRHVRAGQQQMRVPGLAERRAIASNLQLGEALEDRPDFEGIAHQLEQVLSRYKIFETYLQNDLGLSNDQKTNLNTALENFDLEADIDDILNKLG
jgi:hypothetical protein